MHTDNFTPHTIYIKCVPVKYKEYIERPEDTYMSKF
jgi:hypothetical protein